MMMTTLILFPSFCLKSVTERKSLSLMLKSFLGERASGLQRFSDVVSHFHCFCFLFMVRDAGFPTTKIFFKSKLNWLQISIK